jgi:hypothetical protein
MTGLRLDAVVLHGENAELIRYPSDEIWLRAVGHGDVQVADYRSEDRDGPPAHSHPWDEAQIVVDGTLRRVRAGHGTPHGGRRTARRDRRGRREARRPARTTARVARLSSGHAAV